MGLKDKLNRLKEVHAISMHVPGHKNMTIGTLGKLEWTDDMTEITGLDDLHSPEDILLELNELLAEKQPGYHAQAVVNGTTTGVLSAIYSVKDLVDEFLVINDAHKSVYHGMDLAGVSFKLLSSDGLLDTLVHNKAVIITYPTYSGNTIPQLAEIIDHMRSSGGLIIVDEAHGAHLGITERFLPSSLNYGADIVIQSYHKMLPALTGASVVFTKDRDLHKNMMKYIDYFETSSPSYLVLASIELAQKFYIDFKDEIFFDKRDELITSLRNQGFSVREADDPAKVMLNKDGVSPYVLFEAMNREDIYSEMVTEEGVLWCLPLFHQDDGYPFELLQDRMGSLSFKEPAVGGTETEKLDFLLGKPAVRSVVPYPPGVPLIHEGEHFTEEVIKSIIHKKIYHVKIEGIEDNIAAYKVEGEA